MIHTNHILCSFLTVANHQKSPAEDLLRHSPGPNTRLPVWDGATRAKTASPQRPTAGIAEQQGSKISDFCLFLLPEERSTRPQNSTQNRYTAMIIPLTHSFCDLSPSLSKKPWDPNAPNPSDLPVGEREKAAWAKEEDFAEEKPSPGYTMLFHHKKNYWSTTWPCELEDVKENKGHQYG